MSEKWNLMKTLLFTILLKGWDIINQQIFHSKVIKNHACNPNMICDASNDQKYQKVIQHGFQRGTQQSSKLIKNPLWDLPGSLWVHIWPTWLQNGAKMVPKDLQMDPKWSSGDPKSSKKSIKSNNQLYNKQFVFVCSCLSIDSILETSFSIPANPFNLQISSQLVTRGAGGRGEAFR